LLSDIFTSLEKQQVLDQAVASADDYHLGKCDPVGLSEIQPLEKEGKEDGDTGHLKVNPDSQFWQGIKQCLEVILIGTLRAKRMNGSITTSSTAFLRD
jgi:hypothetical protein